MCHSGLFIVVRILHPPCSSGLNRASGIPPFFDYRSHLNIAHKLRLCSHGIKRGLRVGSLSQSPSFTITDAPESKSGHFFGVVNGVLYFAPPFEREGDTRSEVDKTSPSPW